jgi:glycerophosphoryl diester phosphodiesterase
MLSALRNFLVVTLILIMGTFLAWFGLHLYGLSRNLVPTVKHPFLSQINPTKPDLVAYRGLHGFPENTLVAFDAADKLGPEVVFWADVRPSGEGTLLVFHDLDLALSTNGTGWTEFTADKVIFSLNAAFRFKDEKGLNPYLEHPVKIPSLQEFLARYPKRRMILNICDNRPGLEEKVIEVIDGQKAGDRVLLQSDQEGLLRDLREKKPEWLFGNSIVRSTQLRMLASIGLAELAPLKGDVYVTPVQQDKMDMLTEPMLHELLRRKVPIYAGPVVNIETGKKLRGQGVQGIITSAPELY